MYYAIYALLDEDGTPFYVGSTNNIKRRMKEHKRKHKRIMQYTVLEEGEDGRFLAEERWIKKLRLDGLSLTNITEFCHGRQKHTEYSLALIREKLKGKPKDKSRYAHLAELYKGKPRNWTQEGAKRLKDTQFKKGDVCRGHQEKKRRESLKKYWETISKEKRSERLTDTNKKAWANRCADRRAEIGRKIGDSILRNHTKEELRAIGVKNGSRVVVLHPDIGKVASERQKKWWSDMTPEYRSEYLVRRTKKILEAKAKKKQQVLT